MKEYNIEKSIKAQSLLVNAKSFPYFAPTNGVCYRCRNNIYTEIKKDEYSSGIDVEQAATSLVTGCPHCHRSYCD